MLPSPSFIQIQYLLLARRGAAHRRDQVVENNAKLSRPTYLRARIKQPPSELQMRILPKSNSVTSLLQTSVDSVSIIYIKHIHPKSIFSNDMDITPSDKNQLLRRSNVTFNLGLPASGYLQSPPGSELRFNRAKISSP